MPSRDVVVIGASSGGVEALSKTGAASVTRSPTARSVGGDGDALSG